MKRSNSNLSLIRLVAGLFCWSTEGTAIMQVCDGGVFLHLLLLFLQPILPIKLSRDFHQSFALCLW